MPFDIRDLSTIESTLANLSKLIFVHGFNVSFEDAARRTAQLAHALDFRGVAFYSWPSRGHALAYTWDEESARWTVPHLQDFLGRLARDAKLDTLHVVAHSMGNRCLTEALHKGADLGKCRVGQCVLAAPDIDAEGFRRDAAPPVLRLAERVTLYASSRDRALLLSKGVHRYPRAGDADPGIIVLKGMDSVDASLLETDMLGHSYYGDGSHLVNDLRLLLNEGTPVAHRSGMRYVPVTPVLGFWEFNPPLR